MLKISPECCLELSGGSQFTLGLSTGPWVQQSLVLLYVYRMTHCWAGSCSSFQELSEVSGKYGRHTVWKVKVLWSYYFYRKQLYSGKVKPRFLGDPNWTMVKWAGSSMWQIGSPGFHASAPAQDVDLCEAERPGLLKSDPWVLCQGAAHRTSCGSSDGTFCRERASCTWESFLLFQKIYRDIFLLGL